MNGKNRDGHTFLLCFISGYGILNFTLALAAWAWWYYVLLFKLEFPLQDLPLKLPLCVIYCLFQLSAFVTALVMSLRGVPGREAAVLGCVAVSTIMFLVETTFSVPEMYLDYDAGGSTVLWANWPCTGGSYMSPRTRYLAASGIFSFAAVAVLVSKRRLMKTRESPGH